MLRAIIEYFNLVILFTTDFLGLSVALNMLWPICEIGLFAKWPANLAIDRISGNFAK